MKIKMVIADDERLIRESLHKLMDWESLGVEVVGAAADGEAALELIKSQQPRILLSDICMPKLDGIELLERVKELETGVYVIFLSAHSNFSYAQSAVKHGAFDYILKPINEDELMAAVARCAGAIKQERKTAGLLSEENNEHITANAALKNLLTTNTELSEENRARLLKMGIDVNSGDLCVGALVQSKYSDTDFAPPVFPSNIGAPVAQNIVTLSPSERVILWTARSLNRERLMSNFVNVLTQCNKELRGVSISEAHPIADIRHIYPECSFASLYPKLGVEAPAHMFCDGETILNERYPQISAEELAQAIRRKEEAAIKALTNRMFWRYAQYGQIYDIDFIKLKCIESIYALKEELCISNHSAQDDNAENDILITSKKLINIRHSFSGIYDEMLAALLRLCDFFASIEKIRGSHLVAQAVSIIKENYREVSLTDAAERLYVTPTYLSRIFAVEMKDTFSRYVQKHRIKVAKKLLLDPQYKIYNIAKMVGYSDVAHFSKAFKQVEKLSPMEYKNLSSQRKYD